MVDWQHSYDFPLVNVEGTVVKTAGAWVETEVDAEVICIGEYTSATNHRCMDI